MRTASVKVGWVRGDGPIWSVSRADYPGMTSYREWKIDLWLGRLNIHWTITWVGQHRVTDRSKR